MTHRVPIAVAGSSPIAALSQSVVACAPEYPWHLRYLLIPDEIASRVAFGVQIGANLITRVELPGEVFSIDRWTAFRLSEDDSLEPIDFGSSAPIASAAEQLVLYVRNLSRSAIDFRAVAWVDRK